MKYSKNKRYDNDFVKSNMMGPNSMIILENLLENIQLTSSMRILDLGCGNGLTSIYLAKEYGVQVFAVDLWISASDNYERFSKMGLENQIIPIHADATQLPFADNYFDAVISIDAYHYFGSNDTYYDSYLARLLKKDALIAIAVPGMKSEIDSESIPQEMEPYWSKEAIATWNTCDWWRKIFSKSDEIQIKDIREMECFEEAWQDWLKTENNYAITDKQMIEADGGRYMNLISIIANKS